MPLTFQRPFSACTLGATGEDTTTTPPRTFIDTAPSRSRASVYVTLGCDEGARQETEGRRRGMNASPQGETNSPRESALIAFLDDGSRVGAAQFGPFSIPLSCTSTIRLEHGLAGLCQPRDKVGDSRNTQTSQVITQGAEGPIARN